MVLLTKLMVEEAGDSPSLARDQLEQVSLGGLVDWAIWLIWMIWVILVIKAWCVSLQPRR